MFVQMHMLQSMPPGNLNRDDTGQPKKCLFGGTARGRISSQCLKRNIRLSPLFQEAFGGALASRTQYLPRLVANALLDTARIPGNEIEGVKAGIAALFKEKKKKREDDEEENEGEEAETGSESAADTDETSAADVTPQLVFFPPPFAKKVADLVVELKKKHPKAYAALISCKKKLSKEEKAAVAQFKAEARKAKESMSVDICLFGRMTTSDLIADVEAACQVAHAISTHQSLIEADYFTAIDDRPREIFIDQTQRGAAALIGSGERAGFFNSAVYYKYLNVDTDALAKTLGEAGEGQARKAAAVLLKAAALATPTGKQNSFAAHSVPEFILVEVSKTKQPISYANAFLEAVQGKDIMRESAQALSDYCASIAAAYAPADTQRFVLAVGKSEAVPFAIDAKKVKTLAELATEVEKAVGSPARAGAR